MALPSLRTSAARDWAASDFEGFLDGWLATASVKTEIERNGLTAVNTKVAVRGAAGGLKPASNTQAWIEIALLGIPILIQCLRDLVDYIRKENDPQKVKEKLKEALEDLEEEIEDIEDDLDDKNDDIKDKKKDIREEDDPEDKEELEEELEELEEEKRELEKKLDQFKEAKGHLKDAIKALP